MAAKAVGFVTPPLAAAWTGSALVVAVACLASIIGYVVVYLLGPAAHIVMADWFIQRNDPEEFKAGGVDYKRRSKPP
jgi:membrane protein YqaA with SNARE-associated domain